MINELSRLEHVSVERFQIPPCEAKNIEINLDHNNQLPKPLAKDYLKHLLTHISNKYEGRIIKLSDFLCFEFYGRNLIIKILKVHVYSVNQEIHEKMEKLNLNEDNFFHISSSTSWSIVNHRKKMGISVYPVSHVGGLSDVYTKIMNIIEKTNNKSKSSIIKFKLCVL